MSDGRHAKERRAGGARERALRWALSRGVSVDDAEDLAQEVALRIARADARAAPREPSGTDPRAIGIARNVLCEMVRADRARRAAELQAARLLAASSARGGAVDAADADEVTAAPANPQPPTPNPQPPTPNPQPPTPNPQPPTSGGVRPAPSRVRRASGRVGDFDLRRAGARSLTEAQRAAVRAVREAASPAIAAAALGITPAALAARLRRALASARAGASTASGPTAPRDRDWVERYLATRGSRVGARTRTLLRYWRRGVASAEIARRLRISPGSVIRAVRRARRAALVVGGADVSPSAAAEP